VIAGSSLIGSLHLHGVAGGAAALTVFSLRMATVGVSVSLGMVFLLIHSRSSSAVTSPHFDDIADAYDVQIPESRRVALLATKTRVMQAVIEEKQIGRRGLDVGCGQGAYVAAMRALGFDVDGIDASVGQVRLAARRVGEACVITHASVLDIPAADRAFDFVYVINVLHHLGSLDEQRRAFAELMRVVRPGGLIFLHEINTRNLLFRFYMGYIFPSLNCIDEGVERWLLPHRLSQFTTAPVVDIHYFTFLPDFAPRGIVTMFRPVERWLERSPLRIFSAHYMAVFQKSQ
jgi:2-polyprenyl-3-methyl-5-hydroxy-6-metoxy-1,4-benzoquinol methylase